MKKTARSLHILLSSAAALFIALSPIIHGLHLATASHHHDCCNVCIETHSGHGSGNSHSYRVSRDFSISAFSKEGSSEGHNPDTCPLCRQFTQLLKNQIVLQSYMPTVLQDSLPEEYVDFPRHYYLISFSNIIPRAPPTC